MLNKNQKIRIRNRGFTLVETIVVIFIFTILALGVTTLFTHIFINSKDRLISMDNIDYANAVGANFTNEIRIAQVGSDGAYPIGQAEDKQIIFFSSYRQPVGQVARIHYYLTDNTLYKGVTLPTGDPLTYNLISEKVQAVQNNIVNDASPIFYYYDGNYTGSSTSLLQPVNINQIKYVKINLNILKQNTRTDTTVFSIIAGSAVRNLKNNLGD